MTSDKRICPQCGRFDDTEEAHSCSGCGVFIPPSQLIDVTTIQDEERRVIRVPA